MLETYLVRMPKQIKQWLNRNKQRNGSSINWQINKILEAQMKKENKKG